MLPVALGHVAAPLVGFAVNVLTQVLAARGSRLSLLPTIFFGFGAGLLTMAVLEAVLMLYHADSWSHAGGMFIANLVIYGGLGYCYFHFINLGETGRRIRLLREIYESPQGLTPAKILDRYNAKDVLAYRLSRLLKNKQVILKDGRYYIGNPTVLWIADLITLLKYLVLGKKSEFD